MVTPPFVFCRWCLEEDTSKRGPRRSSLARNGNGECFMFRINRFTLASSALALNVPHRTRTYCSGRSRVEGALLLAVGWRVRQLTASILNNMRSLVDRFLPLMSAEPWDSISRPRQTPCGVLLRSSFCVRLEFSATTRECGTVSTPVIDASNSAQHLWLRLTISRTGVVHKT